MMYPSGVLAEFTGSYPSQARPNGVVRDFEIVAAPAELPLVDGKPLRVWAYNGQVPGPTLRVKLGETVRVKFTNNLPQDTTIHWHGVRLPNAMDGVPYVTQQLVEMPPALSLDRDRFYHLRFANDSPRIHPIHLHGMFFRLLARDGAKVDEPFFRDTVLVHPHETIDVGVVPTDAGTWMMHCHILEHAEAGMMTTIAVRRPAS